MGLGLGEQVAEIRLRIPSELPGPRVGQGGIGLFAGRGQDRLRPVGFRDIPGFLEQGELLG